MPRRHTSSSPPKALQSAPPCWWKRQPRHVKAICRTSYHNHHQENLTNCLVSNPQGVMSKAAPVSSTPSSLGYAFRKHISGQQRPQTSARVTICPLRSRVSSGRDRQSRELLSACRRARVLTLHGRGRYGETHLALEVAARALDADSQQHLGGCRPVAPRRSEARPSASYSNVCEDPADSGRAGVPPAVSDPQ